MRVWELGRLHSHLKAILPHRALLRARRPFVRRLIPTFAASVVLACFFLCVSHSVASAQIILDGVINEPDWTKLGDSTGGPPPSFGAGNEINALYADIDTNNFYIGVAGNVQNGNSILVFIDSLPGGYTNSNFGRALAPLGVVNFNPTGGTNFSQFDDNFTPNYVLSISTVPGQTNYFWNLYTLSGSLGSGGGPNHLLGDRNDVDLRANPANADQTRGFEARLTYSANGSGVDIAINQSEIKMMAMYINDAGVLSNQFISHANAGETGNFGSGQIPFNTASPNPVSYGALVVINEIDYIMPGANDSEFIELKNIANIPVNLNTYGLRFARGVNSPPDVYRSDIFLPNFNLNPGAYFVICTNGAKVPNCNFTVPPPIDLLENSIPAAVALVQHNAIVDVVSYGGNTGAPYSEGAGVVSADDITQPSLGISRIVDGVDTNRNNVDFGLRCITPGQMNSSQTGGCGPVTATPTVTPTPTRTSTPTSTPSPAGSVTPTGCTNFLANGDFESSDGWVFGQDPVPGKYTSIPVHSGVRSVQLGINPDSGQAAVYSYSSVRQAVSIPHGATLQLRWWHLYKTELPPLDSTDNTQDRQEVILLKPNGDTLAIVHRVRRNETAWQQSVIDLTQYAGYNFVLYFNVINNGGAGRTWGFIDDAELLVCGGAFPTLVPGTPTPTPTPTRTPTPTPTGSTTPSSTSIEQNGYGLASLTLEDPSSRPSVLYQPQPGKKLVGVEVIVRNVSNQTFISNPFFATLVDTSGFLYSSTPGVIQGELRVQDVNPGEQVQGWIGFVIPDGAMPASIKYRYFGTGATLQVGLPANSASAQSFAAAPFVSASGTTPTVTPTNTPGPPTVTPTPSSTGTTMAMAPLATSTLLVQQQVAPQQNTSQPVAVAQALATSALVPVVQRVVVPNGCIELISNGSFDAHGMGWSEEGSMILPEYSSPVTTTVAAQKDIAIRLGPASKSAVAGLSATQQLIRLPKNSAKIMLSFRYYPLYDEPVNPGDFQFVDIYQGDSGQFLGRALGVQENKRAWIERHYDLTPYAGQPVRLHFMVSNDGSGGNIAMYVDDISVLACHAPPTAPQDTVANGAQPSSGPALPAQASQLQASPLLTNTGAISGAQPLASNKPIPSSIDQVIKQQGFAFGRLGGVLAILGIAGAALVLLTVVKRFPK